MKKALLRFGLPSGILLGGIAVAALMASHEPEAVRSAEGATIPRVDVTVAEATGEPAIVEANGVVMPARQVSITPEVAGRIVSTSDRLMPGGRFDADDVLARIDARDYQLAIIQDESRVQQAELELELERGRGTIAAREWELLGDGIVGGSGDAPGLALREPQLASAERAVDAARSGLERARLELQRTELRAPFNAIVLDEALEVGQRVSPTSPVLTLAGTDRFWVRVSVPVERLAYLGIPGVNAEEGSPAQVVHRAAGEVVARREGRVLRLLGELEPRTRTAQLLVGVDDPLVASDGGLPLLPGAFVQVSIEGPAVEDAVRVPRVALRDGSDVWVVGDDETLTRRAVDVGWRTAEYLFLVGGVEPGERVVTSPLSTPIEGMPVRVGGDPGEGVADAR